ncbi:hypothetical protein H6P81_010948 [Aristolochia fimbriata]|uniref:F-box domain-containing protein n=1 Tax=Aristolochia fimbriata TaxID=158543 RepID=A0AAV7EQ59_ARIFI|nr:hypothetical protein H6P81_010948 [Aristolochia fimbriata]
MWRRRGHQVRLLELETPAEEELLVAPHQSNARCNHEEFEHLKEHISNLEAELANFRSTVDDRFKEMEARFVSALTMHPHSSNVNVEIHGHGDREDHSWGNSGGIGVPEDVNVDVADKCHEGWETNTLGSKLINLEISSFITLRLILPLTAGPTRVVIANSAMSWEATTQTNIVKELYASSSKGVTLGRTGKEVGDDSGLSVYCYLAVKYIEVNMNWLYGFGKVMEIPQSDFIPGPLINGLPDDLALLCLARVPRRYHHNLKCVSKRWKELVHSIEWCDLVCETLSDNLYAVGDPNLTFGRLPLTFIFFPMWRLP